MPRNLRARNGLQKLLHCDLASLAPRGQTSLMASLHEGYQQTRLSKQLAMELYNNGSGRLVRFLRIEQSEKRMSRRRAKGHHT